MLARLDAFLLARVFQVVVNLSGREPIWLARQCAALYTLLCVMQCVLDSWTWWRVLGLLVLVPMLAFSFSSPGFLVALGADARFRRFMLVLFLVSVLQLSLSMVFSGVDAVLLCSMASAAAYIAFLYFPACNQPPPPRPRGRLAHGGAL